jgi:hypothetical protein
MKNSTTIILLQWYATLEELHLDAWRMMPRDVSTRWNSTFDMPVINFTVDYQEAIDTITDNRDMKMRKLELDATEWVIVMELRDTLKACILFLFI